MGGSATTGSGQYEHSRDAILARRNCRRARNSGRSSSLLAHAAERLGRPQRLPARETERAEGIGIGQSLDDAGRKTRAQPEIAHGGVLRSCCPMWPWRCRGLHLSSDRLRECRVTPVVAGTSGVGPFSTISFASCSDKSLDLAKAQTQRVRAADVIRHLAMARMHARERGCACRLERCVPVPND